MIALAADACRSCLVSRYSGPYMVRIVLRCRHHRVLLDERRVVVQACRRCCPTDGHVVAVLQRAFPVMRCIPWHSALLFWSDGEASAPVLRHRLPDLSPEPS